MEKLKLLLDTKEKIINFLKGFYEAEGSVFFSNGKFHMTFTNTNLELIKLVLELLKNHELNFNLNGPYYQNRFGKQSKAVCRLVTASRKYISNFLNLVTPSIKTLKPQSHTQVQTHQQNSQLP